MIIGRNRSLTASRVDCISSSPVHAHLGKFYNQDCIFGGKPIKVISPICAYTLLVSAGTHVRARMAPKALIGTASITENGTDQLSYNAARKRKTKMMENIKM